MKFDPSKPHGTVVGHSWAMYEQNGVLFDGAGNPAPEVKQETPKPVKNAPVSKTKTDTKAAPSPEVETFASEPDLKLTNAKEFLSNLLAGGPIDKSVVFKEADSNCQDWESVKTAFAQMNGTAYKRGQSTLWRLMPDENNA